MLRPLILSVAVLTASVAPAFAHSMVRSVSIADGARLTAPPQQVTITFEHAARLGSVQLATTAGDRIPVTYSPPAQPATTFRIPLPRLAPEAYRLTWRVIAEDAHVMSGSVSFTVVAR